MSQRKFVNRLKRDRLYIVLFLFLLILTLIMLVITGCSTIYEQLPSKGEIGFVQATHEISSYTGCPPDSVNITESKDLSNKFGRYYFYSVRCKGRTFFCLVKSQSGSGNTSCHEAL